MEATLKTPPSLSHASRTKILDTAERLFSHNGFSATSLRSITADAGVNLAAVNYYFGSKDQLIVETLSRVIRPLNARRFQLLDAAIAAAEPKPVALDQILDAMLRPCLELSLDPERQQAFQLLGRSLSEEGNFIGKIIDQEWNPVVTRFHEALHRTLPSVPEEDLFWCMHFTIGAMVHTSCHHKDFARLSGGHCQVELETLLQRLIAFATAGLRASSR